MLFAEHSADVRREINIFTRGREEMDSQARSGGHCQRNRGIRKGANRILVGNSFIRWRDLGSIMLQNLCTESRRMQLDRGRIKLEQSKLPLNTLVRSME